MTKSSLGFSAHIYLSCAKLKSKPKIRDQNGDFVEIKNSFAKKIKSNIPKKKVEYNKPDIRPSWHVRGSGSVALESCHSKLSTESLNSTQNLKYKTLEFLPFFDFLSISEKSSLFLLRRRGIMSTELVLKSCCSGCGSTTDLYGSNCKHMTLCLTCGKTMAENRAKCFDCGATLTRLIRVRFLYLSISPLYIAPLFFLLLIFVN